MKRILLLSAITLLFVMGINLGLSYPDPNPQKTKEELLMTLKNNQQNESLEAFDQMMKVIAHKRCVNCHPTDDYPRQGEDSHVHLFNVQRGEDGHGMPVVQCGTCHQTENNSLSGVPGAPHWHLAPKSMGWQGLNRVEIAKAMMNPEKNGGRGAEEIEKHLTEDLLVLWVFEPGVNQEGIPREKPPLSKEEYIAAVKKWFETGAEIPEE